MMNDWIRLLSVELHAIVTVTNQRGPWSRPLIRRVLKESRVWSTARKAGYCRQKLIYPFM